MTDRAYRTRARVGFRMTAQRRTVLDVINAHDGHLTAERIYDRARDLNPRISLTTVYRTLNALLESGHIKQVHVSVDHERAYFQKVGEAERFHFRCRGCGAITEIDCPEAVDALRRTVRAHPALGEISQICACLEGYCQKCRQRGGAQ